jgi:uncharacterized protein YbaR (Trm112 family)
MTVYYSCADIKLNLSAYFDEQVTLEEKKAIENHILVCPQCKQELELIKKTSSCLKSYFHKESENLEISGINVKEKVINKIMFYKKREKLAYAAAVAVILTAVFYLSSNFINSGDKNSVNKTKYKHTYVQGKNDIVPLREKK